MTCMKSVPSIGLDSMSHFVMKWVGTEDFSVVKRSCVANNDSPLVVGARVSVKVPDASGRMQRYDGDILARGRSDIKM